MNGLQIQYLLGIYFIVASLGIEEGKLKADIIKIVAGGILFFTAIFGLTLLK